MSDAWEYSNGCRAGADPHKESSWLLTNIMHAQGGCGCAGRLQGKGQMSQTRGPRVLDLRRNCRPLLVGQRGSMWAQGRASSSAWLVLTTCQIHDHSHLWDHRRHRTAPNLDAERLSRVPCGEQAAPAHLGLALPKQNLNTHTTTRKD